MQSTATTAEQYLTELPEDRKDAMMELRKVVLDNLPKGFKETMNYGMLTYVVPHTIYPAGYHCNPKLALPFISIASQKNFIALHHMGIYADEKLFDWFQSEFPKYVSTKLDMGKGCIRFKKTNQVPFKLIGELAAKITVEDWIKTYESKFKK
jgi:uncharacterized protein YdhG (YjbR/CyaY superfamily)